MPWDKKDDYDDKDADWFEEVEQADVDLDREFKDVEGYVEEYDGWF